MDAQDRRTWLAKRRQGLGGSDIAAILGENPFQSQLDVYLSKIGEVPELEGPAIKRGRALEPIARKLYEQLTDRRTSPGQDMIIDAEHPVLFANVDGFVHDPTMPKIHADSATPWANGVLELKAPGLRAFSKMKDHGVPKYYLLQIQHYLGVTGMQFGSFAAFSAERWEMLHFDVHRDDELIRVVRRMSVEWWEEHVVKRNPPAEEKVEIPVDAAVTPGEVTVIDTEQFRDCVQRFFEARGLLEMAEELVDATKTELIEMMGLHDVVEGGGGRFINRAIKGRRTFDQKALAAVQPLDRTKIRDAMLASMVIDEHSKHDPVGIVDRLLSESVLDLEQFYKTGAPSRPFKPYLLKKGVDRE